eukprot:COSAG01_NODE_56466_length_318_cov_0.808219_1_plen_88_part_01
MLLPPGTALEATRFAYTSLLRFGLGYAMPEAQLLVDEELGSADHLRFGFHRDRRRPALAPPAPPPLRGRRSVHSRRYSCTPRPCPLVL